MSNIILGYRVIIKRGDEQWYASGCEFFEDEHGLQWVKFYPQNGYQINKEHMMRTENIIVIRNDDKSRPTGVA